MQIIQKKRQSIMCSHTLTFGKSDYHFHWHEKYEVFQILKNPCCFLVNGQRHPQRGG